MEKVLAYGLDIDRANILNNSAKDFGIDVKILSDKDLDEKVGDLFQDSSSNEPQGGSEFLIFSDFDRNKLRDFLIDLKKNGIVVNHKCVLTKTNSEWTLRYLINHIKDEHRMVSKFRTIGGYVQVAQRKLEETGDLKLKSLIDEAYKLRTEELDEERLDRLIVDFKRVLHLK